MVLSFPQYVHPYEPIPGFSRYAPYPSLPSGGRYPESLGALDQGAASIAAVAAQGASTTGGLLAGLSAMGALAPEFALAGPIGAAIAGLTAVGIAIANMFSGCGDTCVQAANIDNQAAALLQQNLTAYMNAPVHYRSMQLAALNNFDTFWVAYVRAEQGIPTQGAISIAERQRGGVSHWACQSPIAVRTTQSCQGGPPCCSGVDDFTMYRDPIANDPNVVPDPVVGAPASGATTTVVNPDGSVSLVPASAAGRASMTPLLIGAAVIAVALMMGGN